MLRERMADSIERQSEESLWSSLRLLLISEQPAQDGGHFASFGIVLLRINDIYYVNEHPFIIYYI